MEEQRTVCLALWVPNIEVERESAKRGCRTPSRWTGKPQKDPGSDIAGHAY